MESASLLAVRQVMAWGCEQGMSIRGLVSVEQLEELLRVFAGERLWSFELYEPLRAFSHAVPRLGLPDMPARIHFGDALCALNQLLSRDTPAWPTSPTPSPQAFAELGYAATSAGITRLRDEHAAAWREHAVHNKQHLLRAAEQAGGKTAVVIGAGKLYDIPLRKLAERYAELVLVDIDGDALAESVKQASLPPELESRLRLVTRDVTGVSGAFLERVGAACELANEDLVYEALLALLYSYRLEAPPELGSADVVFSSMLLSQLATPLTEYVGRRFQERFPNSARRHSRELQIALAQFTHRMQHDHVQALLGAAHVVALSSDVSEQQTQLSRSGKPFPASPELTLIGAPHLEDLFPTQQARVLDSTEWYWHRVPPSAVKPRGRSVKVVGCRATSAR